ncbi:MAG: ACT domain-containing protein [Pseudomonadota bacterium]
MAIEIVVPLENKPGTLAKVAEALGRAGVNVQLASHAVGARGAARLVADDPSKALAALKAARIKVKQSKEVLEATVPDVPGSLGALARKLAKARVNIEAFYIVGADATGLRCVVAVDKLEKAKAAMRS